jgi:hypothetical protein
MFGYDKLSLFADLGRFREAIDRIETVELQNWMQQLLEIVAEFSAAVMACLLGYRIPLGSVKELSRVMDSRGYSGRLRG